MRIKPVKIKSTKGVEYTLRSPSAADAENVLRHLTISHQESYRNLNQSAEYWATITLEAEAKMLTALESSPSSFMIVVLGNDQIVGGLGVIGQEAEFVRRNARVGMSLQAAICGLKLGTQLLALAIENARQVGFHRLELTVRTYNNAGIALYERAGFRRVGLLTEIAFIDGKFVDEYLYELVL